MSCFTPWGGRGFDARRFRESVALYREMRRLALEAERAVTAGAARFRELKDLALAGAYRPVEQQIEAFAEMLEDAS